MSRIRRGVAAGTAATIAIVATAVGARALLSRQAEIARRRIGRPLVENSVNADRIWRPKLEGDPIELLLLGDSLAAGLGAGRRKETLGGRLAKGLAKRLACPVRLHTAATVGAESPDLAMQVDSLPPDYLPQVAVILIGGNDVTHGIPVAASTQHLRETIVRLRELGAEVVVGTCPDLGVLRPVPQPLRRLISSLSRRLAEAQTETARRAGAHPVDLRRLVGPTFFDEPEAMFSLDRFHPSPLGYRRTAEALLPAVTQLAAISQRRLS